MEKSVFKDRGVLKYKHNKYYEWYSGDNNFCEKHEKKDVDIIKSENCALLFLSNRNYLKQRFHCQKTCI